MDSIDIITATGSQDQIQSQTQARAEVSAEANTTNHSLIFIDNDTIDWFLIPLEIRKQIYQELTVSVRVNVDASSHPTVYFFHSRHSQSNAAPGNFGHLFGPLLPTPSFLTICKKFFHEVRDVVWNTARVKFERRWDLVTAFANQSLEVDPPNDYPHIGYNSISMSPMYTDVFSKISDLRINLTETSDFEGNVSFQEAKRVTKNVLTIIRHSMPALHSLILFVDKKSRIHEQHLIFLPSGWFLEAIFAIRHIRKIQLLPGGAFQGHGRNKAVAQAFIQVFNALLREHLAAKREEKLDFQVRGTRALQARIARKMLQKFGNGAYTVSAAAFHQLSERVRYLSIPLS